MKKRITRAGRRTCRHRRRMMWFFNHEHAHAQAQAKVEWCEKCGAIRLCQWVTESHNWMVSNDWQSAEVR